MPRTPIDPMTALAVHDLSGRRALVTGGSDGIGFEIAAALAGAGARLVLPVRNPAKGEAAAQRIRDRHAGADVRLERLDLSSLDSVAEVSRTLLERDEPLDLLIANAGVMTPPSRQETADGHELQFGTNYLAHAALTLHLLPLVRAAGGRVVTQSSVAARNAAIDFSDLDAERSYDAQKVYGASKLANALFGLELSRRSAAAGWGITSAISHPGVAATNLLRARPEVGRDRDTAGGRLIRWLGARNLVVGTAASAAMPALMAATVADADGRYYGPQRLRGVSGPAGHEPLWAPMTDTAAAARLWDVTQEMTGLRVG